ncbi:hypothetical protein ASC61_04770 [Aeromicrobium sp. Root344]|uniref:N,N-dimethylformamidase beta subunit family domain-containing protein n=1 Tax=Aeromicrobium sp. Root344 TaxID=1736521 RepID=UPI0006F5D69F|nr:N,N-dimethylformamidase beta subunit family domain-containing protein [Aeromicrobium sp. Root344]KQV74368.1 hypothetical protein ASC61_04770 [Aeromicrobium sp. Root344]
MGTDTAGLFGYSNTLSGRPGETLSFHVSAENVGSYRAELVRLRHGFTGSAGPGFLEDSVPSSFDGEYAGQAQTCQPGSYVEVKHDGKLADCAETSIRAYIYPTLPRSERSGEFGAYHVSQNSMVRDSQLQTVLSTTIAGEIGGYSLALDDGIPTFSWFADGAIRTLTLNQHLQDHQWYLLEVTASAAEGAVTLSASPVANIMNRNAEATAGLDSDFARCSATQFEPRVGDLRIGSSARRVGSRLLAYETFNGKIGGVRIDQLGDEPSGQRTLGDWHFGLSPRSDGLLLDVVLDKSPHAFHGTCVNTPTRGVTGPLFQGFVTDFRRVPDEYDAIHFHDDDITDADWPASFSFEIPDGLPSGVYAAKVSAPGAEQYMPFFVLPSERKNRVAVLFSTATYLAYSNDRIAFEADQAEIIVSHTPIVDGLDLALQDHPEFGRSCYEIHNDGSGVVFGSSRRPILTMQPTHRAWFQHGGAWGLPADLCISHWLEHESIPFDAITDHDLDREGHELLDGYDVVITGAHPEYVTRAEIESIDTYLSTGGRLMYLGGNGFFATASFDPEQPHVMELRRADGGTRPHQSPFGDARHTTSGEQAGLWRNKGLPPQKLVGVGFAAQGFDRSTHYERLEDSHDPMAAFVFDGIASDELIGGFGIMGGGAAGAEIDCYDPSLGTAPGALLLATSGPFSDGYLLAAEEVYETLPGLGGTENPRVRADIVLCPIEGGGAYFSVGSIAFSGSLSYNAYDNNVARMTGNVLQRFLRKEPIDSVM